MRRTASRQGACSFISIRGPRCWRRPQSSFPLAPQLRINGNIQTVSSPADPSATAKPRWPVVKRCWGGGGLFVFHFIQFFPAILQLAERHKQRLPFSCVVLKSQIKKRENSTKNSTLPYLRKAKRYQRENGNADFRGRAAGIWW